MYQRILFTKIIQRIFFLFYFLNLQTTNINSFAKITAEKSRKIDPSAQTFCTSNPNATEIERLTNIHKIERFTFYSCKSH